MEHKLHCTVAGDWKQKPVLLKGNMIYELLYWQPSRRLSIASPDGIA